MCDGLQGELLFSCYEGWQVGISIVTVALLVLIGFCWYWWRNS